MKSKLSTTILKSVSIRVLVVILLSSFLSYVHLSNTIERGSKETLSKYLHERGKREESLFLLAQNNHKILKEAAENRFKLKPTGEEIARFDSLFRRYPDGTVRNKKELYDGKKSAGVFIPANVHVDDELKHKIIVMVDLVESYGRAFRSRFQDTYFTTSNNIMVLFWPEVPNWTMEMKADFDMRKEEYVWVADKQNNPKRDSVWTGVYYDIVGKTWMSSLETPIDIGDWTATVGHDVMLDELITRVSSEHLDGTFNIIMRKDGRLIAHPKFLSLIKENGGTMDLHKLNDPILNDVYKIISGHPIDQSNANVVEDERGVNLIGITVLDGPDWFFITIYPHSLITLTALNGIMFIIILALASLGFEIAFLYFGLKRDVIAPLLELEGTVTSIAHGNYNSRVEIKRDDELGQLANSFNIMAEEIASNERLLLQKVEERTRQVDEQRAELVQKSKLASLGQMAGGIAHEINTPLAIIGMKVEQLSESLEEKSLSDDELSEGLHVIKMTNDRIAKIIRGLRFVARDGSQMPMEQTELNFIVEETCGFCSEKMRLNNITFEITKNYLPDVTIFCRPVEISQVLLNVLNNAMDAVKDSPEKKITLTVNDINDSIEIIITDTGPGIPEEIREKIMQPFFTTKEIGSGTGLGLSISLGIINTHKGKFYIDFSSAQTKFVIQLPKE